MAGIALKNRVDLISIMVPLVLEVVAKNYKHHIIICFWIKHNSVRPNHEFEREREDVRFYQNTASAAFAKWRVQFKRRPTCHRGERASNEFPVATRIFL